MHYKRRAGIAAGIILGLIFAAAGLGKLLHQPEALTVFFNPAPDLLTATFFKFFFTWLSPIELVLGLLLIIGVAARLMATLSSVLIAGFIANNGWLLSQGMGDEPCGCFGGAERIIQARLSTMNSLYLDIAMLALALVILFFYPVDYFDIRPWFLARGKIAEE